MQWFRFYSEALHDPKVQRLPGEAFKFWINLLCLASQGKERGVLPDIEDIAFVCRIERDEATRLFATLVKAGLVEHREQGGWAPHNWNGRQFSSDSPTERVRRHRAKKSETLQDVEGETLQKRSGNAPDTDTEADTEKKQKRVSDPALTHPAVVAYRDVARHTPNYHQRQTIVATVEDPERWRAVVARWIDAGWKPGNVAGMLDAYSNGWRVGPNGARPTQADHNSARRGKVVV